MYYILKVRRIIKRFAVVTAEMSQLNAVMKNRVDFYCLTASKNGYHKEFLILLSGRPSHQVPVTDRP
jgi:hypothetical protein